MTDQAADPVRFPSGMVRSVFDNEQVIGKRHIIKTDNKVPLIVVISHMYITMDANNQIQCDKDFAPTTWLFENPTEIERKDYLEQFDDVLQTRNDFIDIRLKVVNGETQQEDTQGSTKSIDFIDQIILQKKKCEENKICVDCGDENESRKCTNCKGLLVHEMPNILPLYSAKNKVNPYIHFKNLNVNPNAFTMKTGEPGMLNPNSFENISNIMFNLGRRAGIEQYENDTKQWVELSWIVCLTSQLTIFQTYMWRHIDVQADWRRSMTYGRAPNAIDISQGSLTCPS